MTDAPQTHDIHAPHAETSLPPVTPAAAPAANAEHADALATASVADGTDAGNGTTDGDSAAGAEGTPRSRRSRGGRGRRRHGQDAAAGGAADGASAAEGDDGAPSIAPDARGDAPPAEAARPRNGRDAQQHKPQRRPQQPPSGATPGTPREGRGGQPGQGRPSSRDKVHPVLERLFTLYPKMFGARFLPLKLGVYQDLLERHGDEFKTEDLKLALGLHARSTRYLDAVAAGHQRHNLEAEPVEPVAPEHVHHAILETFRRRQGRTKDDLGAQLRERIIAAIESSGIGREAYAERVRARDPHSNAALDDALAELGRQAAKREALLRAFEASGKSEAEFADMYGMVPKEVSRTLQRARQDRKADAEAAAAKAAAVEAAGATEVADSPEEAVESIEAEEADVSDDSISDTASPVAADEAPATQEPSETREA